MEESTIKTGAGFSLSEESTDPNLHYINWIYITLEVMLSFTSVVVNGLVLWVMWHYDLLRSGNDYYIFSLLLADILQGLLIPPLVFIIYFGVRVVHFSPCIGDNSFVGIFIDIAAINVVCMACRRYSKIKLRGCYRKVCTKLVTVIILVETWIFSSFLGMLTLYLSRGQDSGCSSMKVSRLRYYAYVHFFGLQVPILLSMFVLHLHVFLTHHYQTARSPRKRKVSSFAQSSNTNNEALLFKTLALMIILYAVCWLPLQITNAVTMFNPELQIPLPAVLFMVLLFHLNCVINPVLFVMYETPVQRKVLMTLSRCTCGLCTFLPSSINPLDKSTSKKSTWKREQDLSWFTTSPPSTPMLPCPLGVEAMPSFHDTAYLSPSYRPVRSSVSSSPSRSRHSSVHSKASKGH